MGNSSRSDTILLSEEVKPQLSKKTIVLGIFSLLLTIALCVTAVYYKDYLIGAKYVAQYGLLGMLIVAFLGGSFLSLLAIPVPYWLLVFTLPSILAPKMNIGAPIVVGVISGVGACLGQLLTFTIGYGSRDLYQRVAFTFSKHLYTKASDWAQRHGSLAVFLMSAIPNPLHLPLSIAMASLRFSVWKYSIYSLLGNIVKSSLIAFCGYFGLTSIFRLLGI